VQALKVVVYFHILCEFGTVIAEAKNKLIVVDDEFEREHVYLIPRTKVDHYSHKQVYFNISENSLREFEI
jgi:hypothetical protein